MLWEIINIISNASKKTDLRKVSKNKRSWIKLTREMTKSTNKAKIKKCDKKSRRAIW